MRKDKDYLFEQLRSYKELKEALGELMARFFVSPEEEMEAKNVGNFMSRLVGYEAELMKYIGYLENHIK